MADEEFLLPDIAVTKCTATVPGIGDRCGASVRLVDVGSAPALVLTITCEMGHVVCGTLYELFTPLDLANAAVHSLAADDFRELAAIVERYRQDVCAKGASMETLHRSPYDEELRAWAARTRTCGLTLEVWLAVREHWDAVDKSVHPSPGDGSGYRTSCPASGCYAAGRARICWPGR